MTVYEIAEMRDDSGNCLGEIEAIDANKKFFANEINSSQHFFVVKIVTLNSYVRI